MSSTAAGFAPVVASTAEPLELAMQRLFLSGTLLPVGARLTVEHVFRSAAKTPLEVIYSFPLPRDAALRAFRITGEGFEAHSELKQTEEAVKAYEQGIADGSLATLARQYGDGVINLNVGNIRPDETVRVHLDLLAGVEARDDGFRFRFPFTMAPAYHPRMRAAKTADGEGEMEVPADEFGDVILPHFRDDASGLHEVGFDLFAPHQIAIDEIGSPSHSIRVKQDGTAPARIALATGKDVPNRDVVLDVRFKETAYQVFSGPTSDGRRCFAAVVPSTVFGVSAETPRKTVFVLDRSGSMQGAPITQARKAIEACLASLTPQDRFSIVAFDDRVEAMDSALLPGSRERREAARTFLSQVDARGGTELAKGFMEAARILNGGGDVLILTDGQVSATEQILAQARAAGIRLFCLGIGSASQDRFLSLLARETGGISRFVTPRERVDLAAVDLFASIGRPVASGLKASGNNISPEPPSTVFAGVPVALFGDVEDGDVELLWDGGRIVIPIPDGDHDTGENVWLLQGSRLITDWEARYASEEALAPLEKRKQSRVAARLSALSKTYGLASREMSLVAVVKRAGDRAGELPETRVVPVGMPQDVSFGAYFGGAAPTGQFLAASVMPPGPFMASPAQFTLMTPPPVGAAAAPPPASGKKSRVLRALFSRGSHPMTSAPIPPAQSVPAQSNEDILMELAASLEPDGGMPGKSDSERLARTVAVLFAFISEGHTLSAGAFRSHVRRLVSFLKTARSQTGAERTWIDRAVAAASSGSAPQADWFALAQNLTKLHDHL